MTSPVHDDHPPGAPVYSAGYQRAVVLLLMLAYTFNSADRTIISIIGQAMKVDLRLSDTQLGLLSGTAFALLYALSGIPLARIAERCNRVTLISVAMIAWSLLTALLGAAGTFTQLLLIRVGVGVGEAGCSPSAHSLISDYVAPARRASALSVYSCGISLGYVFCALVGGYVAQHHGWRTACVVIGLPGIAMAIALRVLVREPPRGHSEPPRGAGVTRLPPAVKRPFSLAHELAELAAVARLLFLSRPTLHVILGLTLASFASYGIYAFVPAYFNRAFDLGYATIGVLSALTGGVAVGAGILLGGVVCDRLAARSERWYALLPALGLTLSLPVYVMAFLQGSWQATAWLLAAAGFLQYLSLGPSFGIVQNVVDTRRRATATAFVFILLNVVALGGGSLFTGRVIDGFAEREFANRTTTTPVGAIPADAMPGSTVSVSFRTSCPGGKAPAASGPTLALTCKQALAQASREGIIATLGLYAWAALHYFLAALGIGEVLSGARARNAGRG